MDLAKFISLLENKIISLQHAKSSAETLGDIPTIISLDQDILDTAILISKLKKVLE